MMTRSVNGIVIFGGVLWRIDMVIWPVDSKRDGLSLSGSQASFPLTTAKREWKRGSMCKREKGLSGKKVV